MRHFFILFLLCFNLNLIKSQSLIWTTQTGGTGSSEALAQSNDKHGNTYITGVIYGSGNVILGTDTFNCNSSLDYFITKFDSTGKVLWSHTAGGLQYDYGLGITTDSTGNVFVCGSFQSQNIVIGTYTLNHTSFSFGGSNMFIAKYSPNGNVIWAKNMGGTGGPYINTASGISSDRYGNIYVCGDFSTPALALGTYTLTHPFGSSSTSVFLAKFDTNGNTLWAKKSNGNTAANNVCFSVSSEPNGNVYISGEIFSPSMSFGTYTLNNVGGNNIFLVKYDSNGNEIWVRGSTTSGSGGAQARSVSTDGSGNVYTSGNFKDSSFSIGTFSYSSTGSNEDIFIARYDSNGNPLFVKTFSASGLDIGWQVTAIPNGVLMAGNFSGPIAFGSTTLTTTNGNKFAVSFDLSGNIGCVMNSGFGGGYYAGIGTDKYGNWYISGENGSGNINLYLNKYNSCGITTDIKNQVKNETAAIYPNPNNGSFKLKLSNDLKEGRFVMTNILGQEVFSQNVGSGENEIRIQNISKGLYNYSISGKEQMLYGKILIE